jgi:hypothetical protein
VAGTIPPPGQATTARTKEEHPVSLILIVILILILVGSLPTWGYSSGWGPYPSGGVGLVLLIVIILLLMGRL